MGQGWYSYAGNMHMHTPYSDGEKGHTAIAADAIDAGLDFIIVTDHNIWVQGHEGYIVNDRGRVLLLCGEEVHDVRRDPQCNHLLIYGAERELSPYSADPQTLIDAVAAAGGCCFLAHPHELDLPLFGGKPDLGWKNWEVTGYAGLEIWNYMSSFANEIARLVPAGARDNLPNKLRALPVALRPEKYVTAPEQATLDQWDALLAQGRRIVAVGNSDAHGTPMHLGPIQREIFPYEFLFRAVNTHVVTSEPLQGDYAHDKQIILHALSLGRAWVGYDLPHTTRGFRFTLAGARPAVMGDQRPWEPGLTMQVRTPAMARIRLIRHGEVVAEEACSTLLAYTPPTPGAYRVECSLPYLGRERGWIYSNPIYLV